MAKKEDLSYLLNLIKQLKELGIDLYELVKEAIPLAKKIYNVILQIINVVGAAVPVIRSLVNKGIGKAKAK